MLSSPSCAFNTLLLLQTRQPALSFKKSSLALDVGWCGVKGCFNRIDAPPSGLVKNAGVESREAFGVRAIYRRFAKERRRRSECLSPHGRKAVLKHTQSKRFALWLALALASERTANPAEAAGLRVRSICNNCHTICEQRADSPARAFDAQPA